MSLLGKLKHDFLAALPVIGPHAFIECELLLAGKKPVGWLPVLSPEDLGDSAHEKKLQRDINLLDEAVLKGKLSTIDEIIPRPIPNSNATEDVIIRYYCQLGQEKKCTLPRLLTDKN